MKKVFANMPIMPNAKTNDPNVGLQDLHLTESKNPKQSTSEGSPSGRGASGDGKNSEQQSSNGVPEQNWTKELREGLEPEVGEFQDENDDEGDSSEEETDEDSSDDEEIKAPLELMGEFLQYVRTSDWENASKLCKMILIYEPQNPEALQFQSVIAEKEQIEKELAEMSSTDEEEESSSEEEETEDEEQEDESQNPNDEKDEDSPDEFEPRPGSKMKNKLVFPHLDPVWKP